MIQTYYALGNQSIYDICGMTYGSLDNLFKLMQDNNFGSVNNVPVQGQAFSWDDTLVINEQVTISNSLNNVVYATRSSSIGNIFYNIQSNGLPVSGGGIITPNPTPGGGSGSATYDYYLVFNNDIRLSNGTLTFTDPYLKGKTGYAIYAQQNSAFFSTIEGVDIHYDSVAGSFTILTPGFTLIDAYYLVIYPNKYDTSIP
jgi:hypothetical protein